MSLERVNTENCCWFCKHLIISDDGYNDCEKEYYCAMADYECVQTVCFEFEREGE